jgi:hypothetical protein
MKKNNEAALSHLSDASEGSTTTVDLYSSEMVSDWEAFS